MRRKELKHPDWTDRQCSYCQTTLTKQEVEAGECFVCHTQVDSPDYKLAQERYFDVATSFEGRQGRRGY